MEIDFEAILKTYVAECDERLAAMEEALVALEADPQNDKFLEAIFRGAHTIKGNAGSLGFPKVAGFAHAFEDLLQRFRNHSIPVTGGGITLLLRSLDALREMIAAEVGGAETVKPEHVKLQQQLTDGNTGESTDSPAPGPVPTKRDDKPAKRGDIVDAVVDYSTTIRVDTEKLNRMLNLAGEIAIAQGRLRQAMTVRGQSASEALEAHDQVERLSLELQEQIMRVRMVPVGPTFRQYLRIVRDLAQGEKKLVRLETQGDEVEVDMSIIEHLKDPLTHMIRNALDHGIETPEARQVRGKNPCGVLKLQARHEGGSIVIEVSDDGNGLDREKILARALALGMVSEAEQCSDEELYGLIFAPGFSTATTVTDLSGRGVGMDVVKSNIEALRGTVSVHSQPGAGASIRIQLPLTLAIIDGFGVGVGDETYVLPLHAVIECIEMPVTERQRGALGVIDLRGAPLPYVRLRDWFGLTSPRPRRENIVVVEIDRVKAGLAVDALYGARQTVIKPLGDKFKNVRGIAGSTILGNGLVALILDVPGLMRAVMRAPRDEAAPPLARWRGEEAAAKLANSAQFH
jgi:two-component system chemotaxis sensor kinase CheA